MSAQVIDNLMEQIKTLRLQQQIAIGESVSQLTNDMKELENQLAQYVTVHNKQVELISQLRGELAKYRHISQQAASALEHLKHCLLSHYDAHSASAQDRAALLDADLVLAEAYKLTQKEAVK